MEPDAQHVRFETPVSGSDPEPGTQREEVSAATPGADADRAAGPPAMDHPSRARQRHL
jgi:hypothetical protein